MAWEAPDGFMEMPVAELAMLMLRAAADAEERRFYSEFFWIKPQGGHNGQGNGHSYEANIRRFGEAWDWLFIHGFTATSYAPRPQPSNRWESVPIGELREVTAAGRQALGNLDTLSDISWANLLSAPLHPAIDSKVRSEFAQSDYATAVFSAFRAVEIKVREAGQIPSNVVARQVMYTAFNESNGVLREPGLDSSEQKGRAELYAGAMAVFKNPGSHREVDYDDPIEAAKAILFADLLLRMLDHTLEVIGASTATSDN